MSFSFPDIDAVTESDFKEPWTVTCILLCLHKWVSDVHIFARLCLPSEEQSELQRGVKNPKDDSIPTASYIPNWVTQWAHWQTPLKQRSLTVKIFFFFFYKINNSNSTVLSYNNQRIMLSLGLYHQPTEWRKIPQKMNYFQQVNLWCLR